MVNEVPEATTSGFEGMPPYETDKAERARIVAFFGRLAPRIWAGAFLLLPVLAALGVAGVFWYLKPAYWGYAPFFFYVTYKLGFYVLYLMLLPSCWALWRGHDHWGAITFLTISAFCSERFGELYWLAALVWCFVPYRPAFDLTWPMIKSYASLFKARCRTFFIDLVIQAALFLFGWVVSGFSVGWWR